MLRGEAGGWTDTVGLDIDPAIGWLMIGAGLALFVVVVVWRIRIEEQGGAAIGDNGVDSGATDNRRVRRRNASV